MRFGVTAAAVVMAAALGGCGVERAGSDGVASSVTSTQSTASSTSTSKRPGTPSAGGTTRTTSPPATTDALAYCPGITESPGVTQEPLFISWRQIAEDAEVSRDELTWIDEAPSSGPGANLVAVRAVDLTTGGEPRAATGILSDVDAAALRSALNAGSRVVVATTAHVRADGNVGGVFAIVLPAHGDPYFVGVCAFRDWEQNLRRVYGRAYAEVVTRLAAGPVSIPRDPVPAGPTFLLPGEAPAEVLSSLEHITVEFDLPEQWSRAKLDDSYVLITKVDAGWNEALPMTWVGDDPRSTRIGAYIPAEGNVELWLLANDGDVDAPVGRLAAFDARELLRLSKQGTLDNTGTVRVTISTDFSAQEVVRGNLAVATTVSGLR